MKRYNDETLKELFFDKGLEAIEDMKQIYQFIVLYPKDFIPEKLAVHLIVNRVVKIKDNEKENKFIQHCSKCSVILDAKTVNDKRLFNGLCDRCDNK